MALEWQSRGELPVEIPLLDTQKFHSIFTCPVSKEQPSAENYPMMLLCGHVILKEPLVRLGKGNPSAKFKVSYDFIFQKLRKQPSRSMLLIYYFKNSALTVLKTVL
jgi:hypothetical protein